MNLYKILKYILYQKLIVKECTLGFYFFQVLILSYQKMWNYTYICFDILIMHVTFSFFISVNRTVIFLEKFS